MRSLETITHEVEAVIIHSQDYSFNLELKDLITRWRDAKSFYIDKFNGETRILLGHITTELTEEQKQIEFEKMLKKMKTSYRKARVGELTIEDFILENRESFFDNRVSVEHRDLKLTRGMKLTKSFKYFLPFSDCRVLQDYVSRYIQSGGVVEGDLYLSVDPIDFLTSSENNYNWRNCHSLDGDYRSGNLNYMTDDTTLIAYLQTTDNAHLRCCPEEMTWNDKRWRMFIHTNQFNTVCYYNRQYPFDNKSLFDAVADKVKELSYDRLGTPNLTSGVDKIILSNNGNTVMLTNNYILGERNKLYDTRSIFDLSEFNGYFDPAYSPYFTPIFSNLKESKYASIVYETEDIKEWDKAFHSEFDITIGRACRCVRCGDDHIARGDSFLCDLCIADLDLDEDDFLKCDCCGARLYSEDEGIRMNGDLLCQTCYEATRYPVRANNNLRDMLRRRINHG